MQASGFAQTVADLEATEKQIEGMERKARDQVRAGKRIALEQQIGSLESQVEISTGQLAAFEKEVEQKGKEADSVGHSSVAVPMARAEVENIERVFHAVQEEKETLRVELRSKNRVEVLGDKNSPATVPESPD